MADLSPGRIAWLLCSATNSSSSKELSLFSDEETPSALLAQAEKEDAGGGRLRRVFQRHSVAANSLPGELKALVAVHLAARASLGYEDSNACKSCLANLLLATHGEQLSIVKRLVDFPYVYVLAAAESVDGGSGLSSLPQPQGVEEIDMLALAGLLPLPTQAHFVQHVHVESEATLAMWVSSIGKSKSATSNNGDGTNAFIEQGQHPEKINGSGDDVNGSGDNSNAGGGKVSFRTKIYCDWDDTVRASLFDCSFPRNTVYPGYISFIQSIRGEFDQDSVDASRYDSDNGVSIVSNGGEMKIDQQRGKMIKTTDDEENGGDGDDDERRREIQFEKKIHEETGDIENDDDDDDDDDAIVSTTEAIVSQARLSKSNLPNNESHDSSISSAVAVDIRSSSALHPIPTSPGISTPERTRGGGEKSMISKGRGAGQLIDTTNMYLTVGQSSSSSSIYTSSSSSSSTMILRSPSGGSWWDGLFGSSSSSSTSSSTSSPLPSTPPRLPRMAPLPVAVTSLMKSSITPTSSPQASLEGWQQQQQKEEEASSSSTTSSSLLLSSSSPLPSSSSSQQPPQFFSPPPSSAWPGKVMRLMERGVSAATKVLLHSSSPSSSPFSSSSSSSSSYSSSLTGSSSKVFATLPQRSVGALTQADLVYISARPRFLRSQTMKHAQGIGVGHAAILTGTISAALSHDRLAARKLLNHLRHWTLFREYRVLFIGDSGQADVSAAIQILLAHEKIVNEESNLKGKDPSTTNSSSSSSLSPMRRTTQLPTPLCLIHDIRNSSQEPRTSVSQRAALLAKGVHVFDSYVDAAFICFQHGLITKRGLRQVVATASFELSQVNFTDERMKSARLEEYNDAVKRMHSVIKEGSE